MESSEDLLLGRFCRHSLLHQTLTKSIYILQNTCTNESYLGKFQSKSKLDKINTKNVLHEASFMQQMQGHLGVPLMYWSGVEGVEIVLICQLLGKTVEELLGLCGGKFSAKTGIMLAIRMLEIVRCFHEKGILIRNVSAGMFQFGKGLKSSTLYVNDLIDCKRYRNKKNFVHIAEKKGVRYGYESCFGSERFYNGVETSRIDDIYSVFEILLYMITGVKKDKKGKGGGEKIGLLSELFNKCNEYSFADEPPYEWFTQKLESALFHRSKENDGVFDWMLLPSRLDSLRVPKTVLSLTVEEDKEILAAVYDGYEQGIDVDEITTRHWNYYGEGARKGYLYGEDENTDKGKEGKDGRNDMEEKIKKRKAAVKDKSDCALF